MFHNAVEPVDRMPSNGSLATEDGMLMTLL